MGNLPKGFLAQRLALGFDRVDYGVGGIELLSPSDLTQESYSDRVVIGSETACGDSILVSTDPPHAVFAESQEGWERLIAPTLNSFWKYLRVFSEFSRGRSNPVELEANRPTTSEIQAYIANLRALGSDASLDFWLVQAEIDPEGA